MVQTTSFVLRMGYHEGHRGTYCRLVEPTTQQGKEDMFLAGENRYAAEQTNFFKIPGSPIAYWACQHLLSTFDHTPIADCGMFSYGVFTCNNARFLRLWHECDYRLIAFDSSRSSRWRPLNKGGTACKWYGNLEYIIDYGETGETIRLYRKNSGQSESLPGEDFYFHEHISWSLVTSGTLTFRYYPVGMIFDISAPSMFNSDRQLLLSSMALLNSKVGAYYLSLFNPTMNNTNSDIKRTPFLIHNDIQSQVLAITQNNIKAAKADWDSYETSWDFKRHPLV